jgi:hypothetical protein
MACAKTQSPTVKRSSSGFSCSSSRRARRAVFAEGTVVLAISSSDFGCSARSSHRERSAVSGFIVCSASIQDESCDSDFGCSAVSSSWACIAHVALAPDVGHI